MIGKVTTWQMTEEERLAYIEKHPIRPIKKPKGTGFSFDSPDYKISTEQRKENARKARAVKDYKWRSKKAAESRWGN